LRLPGHGVESCGLLDFQDAGIGPLLYDLVSLLEDARHDLPASAVATLADSYRRRLPPAEREGFEVYWALLAAVRHLRIMAVFTRHGRCGGKPQYLQHLPRLKRLVAPHLAHPRLAAVSGWLRRHTPDLFAD